MTPYVSQTPQDTFDLGAAVVIVGLLILPLAIVHAKPPKLRNSLVVSVLAFGVGIAAWLTGGRGKRA